METAQALTAQKVDDLRMTFDTGMVDLKDVLKHRDAAADARRAEEREELKHAREERKWFYNKVFAIIGSILTLAAAGGGAAYWAMDAPRAPAPAPAPVEVAP